MLIDTHAFLWWVEDDKRLSAKARLAITNSDCGVSFVTAWELAIKVSIGKLKLRSAPTRYFVDHVANNQFIGVPIEVRHFSVLESLPMHHHDPFDRLLVAQAIALSVPIVSADKSLSKYGVKRIF
jgi:PIN domain nuclease of toxin-antitoxin system